MQQSILGSSRKTSALQQSWRRRLTKHAAAADKQEREQTDFQESIRRGQECERWGNGTRRERPDKQEREENRPYHPAAKGDDESRQTGEKTPLVGFTTPLSKFSDKNILFKVLVYFFN